MFLDDTRRDDSDADDDNDGFGGEPFGAEPMDMDGAVDFGESGAGDEDFFTGDQAVNDDYIGDAPMPDTDYGAQSSEEGGAERQPGGAFVPFDPRHAPNERDMVMAMTGDGDGNEGGMMDYFDQNFLKNWAGPEHWKLRKVVRKRELVSYLNKGYHVLIIFGG